MSALLARNWWVIALRSVVTLVFGLIAVLMPSLTLASLVLLFAAFMLMDGVFAIAAAIRAMRRHKRWGLLVFEGIANIVAGLIALFWPLITITVFILLMAVWAVVSGSLLLSASFRLDRAYGRWWMMLSSAISIVWGILLMFSPFIGAIVLTWWIGVYALFVGSALLVLAFKLWRYRAVPETVAVS